MTYLIIESHLSYCIALDEAGCFIKVANLRYEVGQYVENVIELKLPEKTAKKFNTAAFGSIAACLLLFFSLYRYNYMLPFGTVYLSVNPDIRLEISRRDTVVGLNGLNEDGELLLRGYEYRGKHTIAVTNALMDRAIGLGFLSDGDTIVISIDAPNDEWLVENGIMLRQKLNEHLSDIVHVRIIVEEYNPEKPSTYTQPQNTEQPKSPLLEENVPTIAPPKESAPPGSISDYGSDSEYGNNDSCDSGYTAPTPLSTPANIPAARQQDSSYSSYESDNNSAYSDNSNYQEPSPNPQPVSNAIAQPQNSEYNSSSYGSNINDSDYDSDSGYDNNSDYDNDSDYGD